MRPCLKKQTRHSAAIEAQEFICPYVTRNRKLVSPEPVSQICLSNKDRNYSKKEFNVFRFLKVHLSNTILSWLGLLYKTNQRIQVLLGPNRFISLSSFPTDTSLLLGPLLSGFHFMDHEQRSSTSIL